MEWSWPFISRRRHKQEMAFIDADRERLRGERNQFAKDRDAVKAAAEQLQPVVARQAAELAYFREQNPDAPLPYPKPAEGDVELRRQLALARQAIASLDAQLCGMQKANEALTRELREAREGVAS